MTRLQLKNVPSSPATVEPRPSTATSGPCSAKQDALSDGVMRSHMRGRCAIASLFALAVTPAVGFQPLLQHGSASFGTSISAPRGSFTVSAACSQASGRCTSLQVTRSRLTKISTTLRAAVNVGEQAGLILQSIQAPSCPGDGVALVVLTGVGDLRVHDHGGFAAAASAREVHCVVVLDPSQLARMPDRRIRTLAAAVRDVGHTLQKLGVELQFRVGDARTEMAAAVDKVKATHVYVHSDPESSAMHVRDEVTAGAMERNVEVHTWNSALRSGQPGNVDDFLNYQRWVCTHSTATLNAPLPSHELLSSRDKPSALPAFVAVPTADELIGAANRIRGPAQQEAFASRQQSGGNVGDRDDVSETWAQAMWAKYKSQGARAFAEEEIVPPQDAADSLEKVASRVYGAAGLAHGEPFLRGFSEALALGCISPRVIVNESTAGTLTPVWSQSPVPFVFMREAERSLVMAREAVEAREWHRIQALRDNVLDAAREDAAVFEYKYWRWKGFLVRYAVARRNGSGGRGAAAADGRAVVLVHGFGASADQWHSMMAQLKGHSDVWALDLLGFGHSEKPTLSYTQFLWEDCVRDFVLEVVQRPAVLAGNSIGGYTALCAAVSLGAYCPGLVLCNSAGRMLPKAEWEAEKAALYGGKGLRAVMETQGLPAKEAPPNWALDLFGRAIIAALRPNVAKVCKQVYPNALNPKP
jgi:hypothetical protein